MLVPMDQDTSPPPTEPAPGGRPEREYATKQLKVRVTPSLYRQLKILAARNERSLQHVVECLLVFGYNAALEHKALDKVVRR